MKIGCIWRGVVTPFGFVTLYVISLTYPLLLLVSWIDRIDPAWIVSEDKYSIVG